MSQGIRTFCFILSLLPPLYTSHAATAEIPIDVGIGPAAHFISGAVQADQLVHTGLVVSIDAIIDKALINTYKNRIPEKYRDLALSVDEARVSPSIFIPDTLFISPKQQQHRPIRLVLAPGERGYATHWQPRPAADRTQRGLRLTYLYMHSTSLPSPTHFIRPGVDLGVDAEIPVSTNVLFSMGWNSQAYIPQEIGGSVASFGTPDTWMWHVGQAYLKVHYRFPYTVSF